MTDSSAVQSAWGRRILELDQDQHDDFVIASWPVDRAEANASAQQAWLGFTRASRRPEKEAECTTKHDAAVGIRPWFGASIPPMSR